LEFTALCGSNWLVFLTEKYFYARQELNFNLSFNTDCLILIFIKLVNLLSDLVLIELCRHVRPAVPAECFSLGHCHVDKITRDSVHKNDVRYNSANIKKKKCFGCANKLSYNI
jgi:hypothetical protein